MKIGTACTAGLSYHSDVQISQYYQKERPGEIRVIL